MVTFWKAYNLNIVLLLTVWCFCFLSSGPNDHIFVYFTDHGAPGLIAFPDSEVSLIYSHGNLSLCTLRGTTSGPLFWEDKTCTSEPIHL